MADSGLTVEQMKAALEQKKQGGGGLTSEQMRTALEQKKNDSPLTLEGVKEATIQQLPMIGTVVGGLGGSIVAPGLGSLAGAGGGAAVGKGLQDMIRAYQRGDRGDAPTVEGTLEATKGQAIAGLEGLMSEAGGQALSKGLGMASNALASKAKDMSEKTAIRGLTPTVSQVEKINRGKGINKVGRVMIDEKITTPFSTAEDMAKNAEQVLEKTGKEIGKVYQGAAKELESVTKTVAIDSEGKAILDQIQKSGFKPVQEAEVLKKEFADELHGQLDGTAALKKLSGYADEIAANGNDVSIERALEIRRSIDKQIKWGSKNLEHDLVQQGLYKMRDRIQTRIEEQIGLMADSGFLNPDTIAKLKGLNKTFSTAADIVDISGKTVARNQAKQVLGLSEKGLGMMGLMGSVATQDPKMAVLGVTAAVGSKLSKKYGAAVATKALDSAAKILANNPAAKALAAENPNYVNILTDQLANKMSGGSALPSAAADDPNNPIQRRLQGQ